jgi:hypothetical protein
METTMFISMLILILLLPFTFLPLALDAFFSSDELGEMGVYFENPENAHSLPVTADLSKAYCAENACQLWNITKQVMG